MAKQQVRIIDPTIFSSIPFFKYVEKGTQFFHRGDFERAIEEWEAAKAQGYGDAITLKKIGGKVASGVHLEQVPIISFLHAVYTNQLSGIGVIKSGSKSKRLIFSHGELIYPQSFEIVEQLKKQLVKRGTIDNDGFHALQKEAIKKRQDLSRFLMGKKLHNIDDITRIHTEVAATHFSELLSFTTGSIGIIEQKVIFKPFMKIPPIETALTVALSEFHYPDFLNHTKDGTIIFRPSAYLVDRKENILSALSIPAQYLFSLIDGTRNVEQIIRFTGTDIQTTSNLLFQLARAGLIRRTREVVEYEDREFNETSRSIGVLFDIYKLVTGDLFRELGLRGKKSIEDARKKLSTDYQKVFTNMDLAEPDSLQEKEILRNLSFFFPNVKSVPIFIHAFHGLYLNVLDELNRFLGVGLTSDSAKEISNKIKDIERYASNSELKNPLMSVLTELARLD